MLIFIAIGRDLFLMFEIVQFDDIIELFLKFENPLIGVEGLLIYFLLLLHKSFFQLPNAELYP